MNIARTEANAENPAKRLHDPAVSDRTSTHDDPFETDEPFALCPPQVREFVTLWPPALANDVAYAGYEYRNLDNALASISLSKLQLASSENTTSQPMNFNAKKKSDSDTSQGSSTTQRVLNSAGIIELNEINDIQHDSPFAGSSFFISQEFGSHDFYRTTVGASGPLNDTANLFYNFSVGYGHGDMYGNYDDLESTYIESGFTWLPFNGMTISVDVLYSEHEGKLKKRGRTHYHQRSPDSGNTNAKEF